MRVILLCGLVTGLLVMSVANAQLVAVNDVGISVVPRQSLILGTPAPQGTGAVCPDAPVLASLTGEMVQDGRIFRDGIPSECPNKVYPGIFSESTQYNYETFTYRNTGTAAACVTVNFDPAQGATPCATNAHASAYIGSYDPMDQATNYVGDVGSSVAQPFAFEVPGDQDMVLVVTNTASAAVCDFAFEVVSLPCSAGGTGRIPTNVSSLTYYGLGILALGLGLIGFFTMRAHRL